MDPPPYQPKCGYPPIASMLEAAQDTRRSARSRCKIVRDLAKLLDVPLEPTPFWGKSSWLVFAISLIQATGVGFCHVSEFRGYVQKYAKDDDPFKHCASRTSELRASNASPCQSKDACTRFRHGVAAANKWQYGKEFIATCDCK